MIKITEEINKLNQIQHNDIVQYIYCENELDPNKKIICTKLEHHVDGSKINNITEHINNNSKSITYNDHKNSIKSEDLFQR